MDQMPSSPPLDPRYRAISPTSSEPPFFSSDDPPDAADVANYESPREKRKRAGPWWENELLLQKPKKAKMSRNFDSGVWLQSDATESSDSSFVAALAPQPVFTSEAETAVRRTIQENVDRGSTTYHLDGFGLNDGEVDAIGELDSVIQAPPSSGVDVPAEGQYRSMEPKLYVNLSRNNLSRLPASLFNIQYLSTLVLRNNRIEELPPSIGNLHSLKELDLSQNSLRWLPREILHLLPSGLLPRQGRLKRLQLIGNPLLEISFCLSFKSIFDDSAVFGGYSEITQQSSFMARTPIRYYDQLGSVIQGSPSLPPTSQTQVHVIFNPLYDLEDVSPTYFVPSVRPKVPSLLRRCIEFAIKYEGVTAIRQMLGDDVPPSADAILSRAEDNMVATHSPMRTCHVCSRKYVVPAADWIEFWENDIVDKFPVRVQVCSWGCVPDEFTRRPETVKEYPKE